MARGAFHMKNFIVPHMAEAAAAVIEYP